MNYPNIDMAQTGLRIQKYIQDAGMTVAEVQRYLHLSCPQPIYRWYKGKILPSVDHLLSLSELLGVHMEDLLVKKVERLDVHITYSSAQFNIRRRLVLYYRNLNGLKQFSLK